jgi:excisionase family DNA binding protein
MKKCDKALDASGQPHPHAPPEQSVDTSRPQPLAWSIVNGAQRAGVSRSTIYKLADEGKLRLVKIAGRRLIPESEIVRLIAGE